MGNWNRHTEMVGFSLRIPKAINDFIDSLLEKYIIPSKAEFIRQCINEQIPNWKIITRLCEPFIKGRPPLGNNYNKKKKWRRKK